MSFFICHARNNGNIIVFNTASRHCLRLLRHLNLLRCIYCHEYHYQLVYLYVANFNAICHRLVSHWKHGFIVCLPRPLPSYQYRHRYHTPVITVGGVNTLIGLPPEQSSSLRSCHLLRLQCRRHALRRIGRLAGFVHCIVYHTYTARIRTPPNTNVSACLA